MDGVTGDPPFSFWIFKTDQVMIAYAKVNGFLNVGYF